MTPALALADRLQRLLEAATTNGGRVALTGEDYIALGRGVAALRAQAETPQAGTGNVAQPVAPPAEVIRRHAFSYGWKAHLDGATDVEHAFAAYLAQAPAPQGKDQGAK